MWSVMKIDVSSLQKRGVGAGDVVNELRAQVVILCFSSHFMDSL